MANLDHTQPEDQFDLIEAWLADELSAEEAEAVAARMDSDPAFKSAAEKHQLAHQLIFQSAGGQLKAKMQALKKEQEKTALSSRRPLYFWLAIAASIILFAFVGSWWWARQHYSTPALIAAYGTPYSAGPLRGGARDNQPLLAAMNAYAQSDYATAKQLFLTVQPQPSIQTEVSFYLANTLFQLGEYASAAPEYRRVIDARDTRFQAAAEWYFLLSMLGNRQVAECIQMASKLSQDDGHPYQKQILRLQQDLYSPARQFPGIH